MKKNVRQTIIRDVSQRSALLCRKIFFLVTPLRGYFFNLYKRAGLLERRDYFFKLNDRGAGLNLKHKFAKEEHYHDHMYNIMITCTIS